MDNNHRMAFAEFKSAMKRIVAAGVAMVLAALTYLKLSGVLNTSMAIATTVGVFFSILLGCGLFAAAFFSEKSGLDEAVTRATTSRRTRPPSKPRKD